MIVTVFGRLSPIVFLKIVAPVQLLAFSTSSSAAVMPLTMKTAVEKLGVTPTLAGAVIPLASTVNMAGTALYQAVAIMFLAEIANVSLSPGDLALIMVTLTGASIARARSARGQYRYPRRHRDQFRHSPLPAWR